MVQLGDIRINIVADNDFDYSGKDWDADLWESVMAKINDGTWDAYGIMIQRAVPGEWDTIDSLWSSVHTSRLHGTYNSVTDIPDQQMRDAVSEMLANNEL